MLKGLGAYAERLSVHESNPGTALASIAAIVEYLIARTGEPPLVAIDYLQKVPAPGHTGDAHDRLAAVAAALKDLALEAVPRRRGLGGGEGGPGSGPPHAGPPPARRLLEERVVTT